MDQTDLEPLIEDLSTDISALSDALAPLLNAPLSTISSKLPLLDKAKLHILATYAIESLLFSSLRLSGIDAKQHPVFTELTRVRQYFQKVKLAEEGPPQREQVIDKEAAGRFIKHALSGNEKLDREREDNVAKQKTSATQKLQELQQIQSHKSQHGLDDTPEAVQEGRRVYVDNLDLKNTEQSLKAAFLAYGFDMYVQ
jgi:exosome complex protein LRP1